MRLAYHAFSRNIWMHLFFYGGGKTVGDGGMGLFSAPDDIGSPHCIRFCYRPTSTRQSSQPARASFAPQTIIRGNNIASAYKAYAAWSAASASCFLFL